MTVPERFPIYAGAAAGWAPGPAEMAEFEAGQKEMAEKGLAAVKVAIDPARRHAQTLYHRGHGIFAVDGETIQFESGVP